MPKNQLCEDPQRLSIQRKYDSKYSCPEYERIGYIEGTVSRSWCL